MIVPVKYVENLEIHKKFRMRITSKKKNNAFTKNTCSI